MECYAAVDEQGAPPAIGLLKEDDEHGVDDEAGVVADGTETSSQRLVLIEVDIHRRHSCCVVDAKPYA